ncbi:esterase FrsA [Nocardia sp. NBC_00565]|uniref:alpha/beta fold hydrolase n=1 Tax=Nocardia sp. NBC_00565 TaxID=2975993 RepID=UPI002E80C0CE|nr:alpha/beta hydrolase [Nocardia sp. NBC_00565]WUC04032.1 esterase FrsA [Nocardia sp. NBC_00565]
MSYQWPLDPADLFGERYPQMVNTGLPAADVDGVRAAITDMWPDAPGGWVREWSELATRYAGSGQHDLAALAYGWAKFPTLVDAAKRAALANQLTQYQLAAPTFGVDFDRRVLELPYRDTTTAVPVHLFTPADLPANSPVLLASGGVDSWKMDMHAMFVAAAMRLRVRVLAFDIAGTGESAIPMTSDGGAHMVRELVGYARTLGNGVVAHLGVSMGGHYSARSGLAGEVDAAIVLGGPVEEAFTGAGPSHFGMDGIIGNALGFDHRPTRDELSARFAAFSLRPLLDQDTNAPMLIVNGAEDVHVPQHDTLVFQGRRDTDVHLIPDTGHCAITKLPEVVPMMLGWLEHTLNTVAPKAHS